ncbi:MAG: tRNA (N(6)-L-threonylcarbamoyladenosine(37)-C(2))-methylthiotransferase [Promethearchaeota archaeon]
MRQNLEKRTFYIETYGCTSNKADSAIIADVLKKAGYKEIRIDEAEIIIINTCAVKEQTENKIKTRLEEIHNKFKEDPNRYIIIAGCLPHITPKHQNIIKKIIPSFAAIIDLDNIHELPVIIEKIKKEGKKQQVFIADHPIDKSKFLIEIPPGKITGIVPISEGCKGACTYCCVKNARGRLICYNPKYIIKNAHHQLKSGIKELFLTSQDCSIYEYGNYKLYDLVKDITSYEGEFFLRIGMINPTFLIHHFNQLIKIFKINKVYQFLHIPIQSGSERVLKKMNRPYRISDIIEPLDKLRSEFPYLTISTDIICGFPGESEYDFYRTINFIKWLKPEILNISKFTARPGTKAKLMKQLSSKTIKERTIRLSKIFRVYQNEINKKWLGWQGKVLILHNTNEPNKVFGRNFAYKNIFITDYKGNIGNFVDVEIYEVKGFNLFASLI